jgi:hypothetical protein
MSDTTNETNLIDEKKLQETGSYSDSVNTFASKVTKFLISIIILILIVLLYFSSSSLILFVCKLAQSNILPSDSHCAPYTDTQPIIKPSPIQTNIFTTFTDPEMSMKLQIPYDINSKNKIIETFKQYKEKSSSNFLANYFIAISESILQLNYSLINMIMNLMNSTLPEPAIILLGPILSFILYTIGIFINTIYFVYLWFSNMSWFFKTNKNDTGDGKPKWEDVSITSPLNWCFAVIIAILFTFLLIFGFPFVSTIPLLFYHNALLSTIFYKAIMNGKQITSFTIIKETLKYYKLIIVSVISLFVVLSSFLSLGVIPGIFSVLTLILIYYGFISIDIFKSIPEKNLSESVSYKQAIKTCSFKIEPKHKKWFFGLFGGQTGGDITKELKKIGKTI